MASSWCAIQHGWRRCKRYFINPVVSIQSQKNQSEKSTPASCGVDVQKRLQYKISTVPLENSSRVFTASYVQRICNGAADEQRHLLGLVISCVSTHPIKLRLPLQFVVTSNRRVSSNGPEIIPIKYHSIQGIFTFNLPKSLSILFPFKSIPKSLMTSWPEAERQIRRVVYKSYPENVKQVELRTTLTLEISDDPVSLGSDLRNLNPSIPLLPSIACQRSVESHLDVLLPSR